MLTPKFEEFYKNTPTEKVPWYVVRSEYLKKLIDEGKIKPAKTLSLGCGLGGNEIFLAKKGFDVMGVDVSETAIEKAKEVAKKEGAKINFVAHDVSDLSFLGDEKFDFILEWALLHCIPKESHEKYVKEVTKHTNSGALLVQRSFSKRDPKSQDGISDSHLHGINYHFDRQDIENLYGGWKILECEGKDETEKYFDQYLMRKK